MAIGAITMILANVGLQIYNNWCGSRQNSALQKKREEFERAARERNTEHMWKLLREGQELTMELEKKKHDDRLKELQGDLDNLLKEITHEQTIVNWPLKVLPIVMKNQAFGNLLANQEENVAMHVLFARSNYSEFNKLVYPIVEKALELHCNQHWSTKSDHPILFYSGSWDTQRCPMNPNDIQITALQTQLSNLPTLLITPFFRPKDGKLVFHVNTWGVGASKNDHFNVEEIEPICDEFHFQHLYTNKDDYEHTIGVLDWIVEDLVPYLECMIGYMADTYFWSSAGLAPHLPKLLTNGTINTDGMKYLVYDSCVCYVQLLDTSLNNTKANPFTQNNLQNLYKGSSELWDVETKKRKSVECLLTSVFVLTQKRFASIEELCTESNILLFDLKTIDQIIELLNTYEYNDKATLTLSLKNKKIFEKQKSVDKERTILLSTDMALLREMANNGDCAAMFRLGEIFEYSICCDFDMEMALDYYQKAANNNYTLGILKMELLSFLLKGKCNSDIIRIHSQSLKEMVDNGFCQAIIMAVAFSHYKLFSFYSDDNLLTTLDLVEDTAHPYAYYLGALIIKEKYGKEHIDKVVALLNKSAQLGSTHALLELAAIYYEGKYVKKSIIKYIEYNKLAAESGSSEAMVNIGYCYATGEGVLKSRSNALKFLQLAAELGNNDAKELLSRI